MVQGNLLIGFTGGSLWTVASTGTYQVNVGLDVDTLTEAQFVLIMYCGGNRVFTSAIFYGYNQATPFLLSAYTTQSSSTYQHSIEAFFNVSTVCQFQAGYISNNPFQVSAGNRMSLSIKLMNTGS